MEKWKVVAGTDGAIEVSTLGRVKSNLRDGRILKQQKDKKGYCRLRVTINQQKHSYKVHRLVATAFIPNPNGLSQVNHIDGDKENNAVSNLEWVSNEENAHHAVSHGLWANVFAASRNANESRKTAVISINSSGERKRFESISDAERYYNSRHISDVINGKRSHAAGCRFERG